METEQEYWATLETSDRSGAQQLVGSLLDAGWDNDRVLNELVVPSQVRVGDLWLQGAWTVAEEHAATAVNEAIVHWLISLLPPAAPDASVVLVACLEGDRHALAALIIAEGLTARGLRVVYLGADPERSGLLVLVLRLRPRAVLFSASLTSSLSGQKMLFHSIAAVGIPLIVGGQAFGGAELGVKRARVLGATAYAATADDVMELLGTLPVRTSSPAEVEPDVSDEDALWLNHYRSEIATDVMRVLAQRHQDVGPDSASWPELAEHVEHVLGCVAAAIVTDDATIMIEVRDWLTAVLHHRGVDPRLVDEVWALLAEPLRGHATARALLASSRPTGTCA